MQVNDNPPKCSGQIKNDLSIKPVDDKTTKM